MLGIFHTYYISIDSPIAFKPLEDISLHVHIITANLLWMETAQIMLNRRGTLTNGHHLASTVCIHFFLTTRFLHVSISVTLAGSICP